MLGPASPPTSLREREKTSSRAEITCDRRQGRELLSAREVGLGSGMAAARTHLACPTAIVNAPIDVVWGLLMNTGGWGQFYDLRVMSVEPPGPAAPGQRLIGVPGRGLLPPFTRLSFKNNYIPL